jgi:hypothetical protein
MQEEEIKKKIEQLKKDAKEDPDDSYFYNNERKKLERELRNIKIRKQISKSSKEIKRNIGNLSSDFRRILKRSKSKKKVKLKYQGIPKSRDIYSYQSTKEYWGI